MIRALIFSAITIGLAAAPAAAIDGTPVWFPSTVSAPVPSTSISAPSLAFDHYGGAAVSWSRINSSSQMNVVHFSEQSPLGLWNHRNVATGIGIGMATTLSFDRAERPTVSWLNEDATVQVDINRGAQTQLIASNALGDEGSLVFKHDIAGGLQGAYVSDSGQSVFGINATQPTITSDLLFNLSAIDQVRDLDFAIDHAGRRHVIATARLPDQREAVFIASEPSFGGNWATAMLDSGENIGGASIAVNPVNGELAIVYSKVDDGGGTSRLIFNDFSGVGMTTTEILAASDREFGDLDLEFDPSDGRPSIALEESIAGGNDQLLFAYNTGGTNWNTSLVDDSILIDTPDGELRPSLAYDDFGTTYPAIAFVDDDGALIVSFDPPIPEPSTAGLLLIGFGAVVGRRRRESAGG